MRQDHYCKDKIPNKQNQRFILNLESQMVFKICCQKSLAKRYEFTFEFPVKSMKLF